MENQSPSTSNALYLSRRDWHALLGFSNQYRGFHRESRYLHQPLGDRSYHTCIGRRLFLRELEAMSKALRDEELDMIVFCQLYCHMLAIGWWSFANIYCYIEDSTFYAAYQLALDIWRALEVQTSHHTITAHWLVVLAEVNIVSQDRGNLLFKLPLAETLEEVATSVAEEAWLNNEHAIYFGLNYILFLQIIFFKPFGKCT